MKKSILLLFATLIYVGASCQDKDINKMLNANQGITTPFINLPGGVLNKKPIMDYPPLGIVTSTGTAWGSSIIDNSSNWNTAFSWGPHSGLYELKLSNPTVDGYVLSSTSAGVRSWVPNGTGGTMVYPTAGIPLSTGSAWGTSIVNNSSNWNTAYAWVNTNGATILGWGPHAGLYRPNTWVPGWTDVTGKPSLFPPTSHTHDYNTDITNKPPEQDLAVALAGLDYLPIPSKTTAQINALVMPVGSSGIVKDATLGVYKVYKDGIWSIVITSD